MPNRELTTPTTWEAGTAAVVWYQAGAGGEGAVQLRGQPATQRVPLARRQKRGEFSSYVGTAPRPERPFANHALTLFGTPPGRMWAGTHNE